MRTVSIAEVATAEGRVGELPARVREALGELAGAANPDRAAVRHGHDGGEVTLGGRRVPVARPRARAVDGSGEVELETYRQLADRDALSDVVLERMLAGVSTRRYARTGEPVGSEIDEQARSQSKSAVSCELVARTRENLIDLMSRPLGDLRLAVLMLDGIGLKGRCVVARWGSTPTASGTRSGCGTARPRTPPWRPRCCRTSPSAALDVEQGVLCVIDGAKALRKAVRNVKRWQNGDMCLRWTAAGMLEAKQQFRRVIGYPKLPVLAVAVERDIAPQTVPDTRRPRSPHPAV